MLFEDACTLAEKHGLLAVLETSAKEAQNIEEVFILMAKELIARNTLQLHGENPPNSFSLDSRPVIASPSVEKTQCSCWRETSGRTWKLPFFWGCLIQFYSVDESVLCGLKPSLDISTLQFGLWVFSEIIVAVGSRGCFEHSNKNCWAERTREAASPCLNQRELQKLLPLIISSHVFLAVSEDKFAPELCTDPSKLRCWF